MIIFFFQVAQTQKALTEVKFLKTEIKRNNISLPLASSHSASTNTTSMSGVTINNAKGQTTLKDKGEKKSEFYVVNNGLLLLHPKKAVTLSGVKKSTEAAPPLINYHVIKRSRNNVTKTADVISKGQESHLNKRSLSREARRSVHPAIGQEMLRAARRLAIPGLYHGRIVSINRYQKSGKERFKFYPSKLKKNSINGRRVYLEEKAFKSRKNETDNPLFDDEQEINLKLNGKENSHKRRKVSVAKKRTKSIPPIRNLPDIKEYFMKPDELHEYPRFGILPFEGQEYPRFPIRPMNAFIYPRFPESSQETEMLHRYPIEPANLAKYPRYPSFFPVKEFPRSEKGLKRFIEYPRFEEIKPLNLDEAPRFPRYPEATPIPEIKDIGDADKRSGHMSANVVSKRHIIAKTKTGRAGLYGNYGYDDDDDEDSDDEDGDDDDNSHNYKDNPSDQWMRNWNGDLTESIPPITHINHIRSPPSIPEIQDIPFLPEIPALHDIKPLKSIKPIPSADKTAQLRNLQNEKGAKFESNDVSVRDLTDKKTDT